MTSLTSLVSGAQPGKGPSPKIIGSHKPGRINSQVDMLMERGDFLPELKHAGPSDLKKVGARSPSFVVAEGIMQSSHQQSSSKKKKRGQVLRTKSELYLSDTTNDDFTMNQIVRREEQLPPQQQSPMMLVRSVSRDPGTMAPLAGGASPSASSGGRGTQQGGRTAPPAVVPLGGGSGSPALPPTVGEGGGAGSQFGIVPTMRGAYAAPLGQRSAARSRSFAPPPIRTDSNLISPANSRPLNSHSAGRTPGRSLSVRLPPAEGLSNGGNGDTSSPSGSGPLRGASRGSPRPQSPRRTVSAAAGLGRSSSDEDVLLPPAMPVESPLAGSSMTRALDLRSLRLELF